VRRLERRLDELHVELERVDLPPAARANEVQVVAAGEDPNHLPDVMIRDRVAEDGGALAPEVDEEVAALVEFIAARRVELAAEAPPVAITSSTSRTEVGYRYQP
jgi:hypothetical protein